MKTIFAILLFVITTSIAAAQGISPLAVECKNPCKGSVTILNGGLKPMAVQIYARSAKPGPRGPVYRALDPGVEIDLSQDTMRVYPKSSYEVAYKLRCAQNPCTVGLLVEIVPARADNGLQTKIILNHMIYANANGKNARKEAFLAAGLSSK